ncbi:hypothetical protein FDP41_004677 [Naegleria fowleri]|uniref:Uncharacterized protein n=1 Tax=Naegleria fowleri TaxID=5763 RepID=A0A6A5BEP3_NAEFO|nr:uncharacterized protein FDP41_004677 [Naegleria fowleri]KAF0976303.1 hypothetical protein FDP41_004677 [Naegleria fowleri]
MGSGVSTARLPAMSDFHHPSSHPTFPQHIMEASANNSSHNGVIDLSLHRPTTSQTQRGGNVQHHHLHLHHHYNHENCFSKLSPSSNIPHLAPLHATTKKNHSHSKRIHSPPVSRVDVSTKTKHTCNDHLSPTQEVHRSKSFSSSPICKFQFTRKIHSFPSSPTTQRNKSPLETTRQLVSQIEEDEDMTVVEDDTPWMLACRLDFFHMKTRIPLIFQQNSS